MLPLDYNFIMTILVVGNEEVIFLLDYCRVGILLRTLDAVWIIDITKILIIILI